MFSADVQITFDDEKLASKVKSKLHGPNGVQAKLDAQIVADTDPFVPFDTGVLASTATKTDYGSGKIVYDTPYARRLYYGTKFNFSKEAHPKATHHWFEVAKNKFMDSWGEKVARLLGGRWKR